MKKELFVNEVREFLNKRIMARKENDLPIIREKMVENAQLFISVMNEKHNTNYTIDIESLLNELLPIVEVIEDNKRKISLDGLKLTIGEKYTMLKPNGLLPELYQFTLINYFVADYAQHKDQLTLIVKFKGHRKNSRLIIAHETAYLFKSWNFSKNWNKEKISDTMSRLHRVNLNDVKTHKDFIINIEMGDSFSTYKNFATIEDLTCSYLETNNIKFKDQLTHAGYKNYIADLVRRYNYNLHTLTKYFRNVGYNNLVAILDGIQKDWN